MLGGVAALHRCAAVPSLYENRPDAQKRGTDSTRRQCIAHTEGVSPLTDTLEHYRGVLVAGSTGSPLRILSDGGDVVRRAHLELVLERAVAREVAREVRRAGMTVHHRPLRPWGAHLDNIAVTRRTRSDGTSVIPQMVGYVRGLEEFDSVVRHRVADLRRPRSVMLVDPRWGRRTLLHRIVIETLHGLRG